ncbi:TetR/AcrR family transcriptional regulator [Mucilaginibacter myungsuensis]|uniref:TetR/AcrR family transcriptional regulator n=1 Tax=Mucilaginibacter myungsuensis TaxID=649104 RepID=A0A929KV19_9SPHI|nr:TetR/AcrR family transcriptional regulator [Mucilaginibacter myungsuensis]MBE9661277.1 TetR/AcrR family transcriptional regulator [Mucilaginibacter myungsuensis]MDN3597420.1 TetR/AcrR family transcriptional regulator [Mucilaginibacter myungsuensis]
MDKDKIDKKDHILDVAERVFSDHGFDGASTRKISGEAGVNMAMLNYYFGSKEGLFLAVINRKISGFRDILISITNESDTTQWEKIAKYIELYSEKIVSNNCFQKLLYQEMGMNRRTGLANEVRSILMQNVGELKKIMREGIEKGEFKEDSDLEMVIATLYGTKNYVVNMPLMSSALFGFDIQDDKMLEGQFKPRMKTYMKNLLKSYLLK